ncbi:MAG: NUDIX domain-containing protein [bacterium]
MTQQKGDGVPANKQTSDVSANKQTSKEIIISTKEELFSLIEKAVSFGYDQIRLPAGTSLQGDYSSQVCILRKIGTKWYIGLLPYNSQANKERDKTQKKKKPTGEKPEDTAVREVDEEFKIRVFNLIEVYRKQDNGKPEERDADPAKQHLYKKHLVHRYITFDFEGEIAFFPDFRNPNDPETGNGFWLSLDLADVEVKLNLKRGPKSLIFFKHLETVISGIEDLLKKIDSYEDQEFSKRLVFTYQNLVGLL